MADARMNLEQLLSEEMIVLSDRGQRLGRTFAGENSLHDTDFRALAFIHLNELSGREVTPALLGAHLSLSSAAVTYLVDRLQRNGLVQRMPDPRDGRRVILRYCDRGRSLTGGFFGRAEQHHRDALAEFDDDEIATATRVVRAVSAGYARFLAELNPDSPVEALPGADPAELGAESA